ncbi:M35 family metallo-endopeptidase [Pseudoduganella namucuonensis]|uniref:Extracellular peptidase. Metallo peptidase. MEROPS family M35 n=1 Tax=Pseudoduganella namucuonensis TaxID=1035707 RepID=A0A1I7KNJ0_9BURK|nr:M35 family metallo-endopeptidase [Pseudoduganella namucuonensis]SFU99017.1 extracellular peptidase. Metallo peptidase. MEROPS family M35 [Pseudoduganella namucuonensis]
MNWNHVVKFGGSVAAMSLCLAANASNGLVASVSLDKHALGPSDDVVVKVTMTNTSSEPQRVLKWHTPFGDIEESLFEVTRDGVKVPYEGMHVKRPAPKASDYFVIQPGKSHTVTVELSALYDMSATGDYSIRYHTKSNKLFDKATQGARASDEKQATVLESDAVSVFIEGNGSRTTAAQQLSAAPAATLAGSLSFTKCSASQQTTITQAMGAATTMANNGDAYLQAGTAGTRYTKWFGSYDAGRYATVKSHFSAIKDAFANKPVTVDCGCNKTYYAYVYPTQPYKIYVCKAFWTAPLTGTDSKGGTLVHEMSHFNAVAGTDDWAYGQSAASSLAISNPTQAIDNADSHEYFGENTPALQ